MRENSTSSDLSSPEYELTFPEAYERFLEEHQLKCQCLLSDTYDMILY